MKATPGDKKTLLEDRLSNSRYKLDKTDPSWSSNSHYKHHREQTQRTIWNTTYITNNKHRRNNKKIRDYEETTENIIVNKYIYVMLWCVYIYIYIYTHVYTYTYICIYVYVGSGSSGSAARLRRRGAARRTAPTHKWDEARLIIIHYTILYHIMYCYTILWYNILYYIHAKPGPEWPRRTAPTHK